MKLLKPLVGLAFLVNTFSCAPNLRYEGRLNGENVKYEEWSSSNELKIVKGDAKWDITDVNRDGCITDGLDEIVLEKDGKVLRYALPVQAEEEHHHHRHHHDYDHHENDYEHHGHHDDDLSFTEFVAVVGVYVAVSVIVSALEKPCATAEDFNTSREKIFRDADRLYQNTRNNLKNLGYNVHYR